MIEKMTKAQERKAPVYLSKWLKMGLRTKSVNKKKATKAVNFLYEKIMKIESPKYVIFLDSPMACQLAANLLKDTKFDPASGGKLLYSQLVSQLYSQLGSQLGSQLVSQLRSQLDSQLGSQLYSQLGSQLVSQLVSQLDSQLGSQLYSQLDSQLGSQLRSQLGSQLGSQLVSQLYSQLDSQLYSQLYSQLRSQLDSQLDSQLRSQLRSQKLNYYATYDIIFWYWAGYYGFYDFVLHELMPKEKSKFKLFREFLGHYPELHYYIPFNGIVFVSDFPKAVCRNADLRLHCDVGAALEYRDTYGLYRLNGVTVSREIAETPAADITKEMILKEQNADVRREIIRKIGLERTIERLGATVADSFETKTGGQYELLMIAYDNSEPRPYLKMTDPSCGEVFILGSKPGITSAREAWSYLNNGRKVENTEIIWEA